jgi:Ca-activated chloride channel family protein
MTLGHPLLLLTLLAIPAAFALHLLVERRRMRYAVRFTNLDVLATVIERPSWRRFLPTALFLLAIAALCVAVARPYRRALVPSDRATVILVIDVSRSMEAQDVKPSRLGAAEEAAAAFLDRVPKRVRVGLIAFAGEAQLAAPPTRDHELVRESLQSLEDYSGFGGTAIGDAVAYAVQVAQQAVGVGASSLAAVTSKPRSARGLASILFLSDGAQTRGILQPLEGADRARAAQIPVYTVALGTRAARIPGFMGGGFFGGFGRRAAPDPATLRAIAEDTGGEFFAARNAKSLKDAYVKLGAQLGRTPGKTEITYEFLVAAAALLVAAGALATRWSPRLP